VFLLCLKLVLHGLNPMTFHCRSQIFSEFIFIFKVRDFDKIHLLIFTCMQRKCLCNDFHFLVLPLFLAIFKVRDFDKIHLLILAACNRCACVVIFHLCGWPYF
jgi:hypothetical protein